VESRLTIHASRYLAMAAEKADQEADFDPIYTYDANGNRTVMIDPTGLTNYNYDELNRLTSITNNQQQASPTMLLAAVPRSPTTMEW